MDINTLLRLLYHYLSIYWPEQLDQSLKPKDSAGCLECRNIKFDFIIVGAGSSGCVLANRLSANPNWKILLLEAGGDEDYITDTPALADQLTGRKYDWNYTTTPQTTVCADNEGRCPFRRGRVMGGTSTINHMLYDRGHPTIYDQWEAMGNPGWNYKSVLYYFKKSENMTIPEFAQDTVYHSTSGPLPLAYPPSRSRLAIDYYDAATYEFGLESTDLNGAKRLGANYVQSNMKGATRCSASKAFLDPIKSRSNLYIFKNTLAIKVLFSERDRKRAIGVTCVTNEEQHNVYASKEVILSAGAIESPKLLMLSGVGPKQHLEQLGISVVMDLPVGQQLIDIPVVTVDLEANTKEFEYNAERFRIAIKEYAMYQSGLLSAPIRLAYAFLNASDPLDTNTIPTSEYVASFVLSPLTTYTDKAVLRDDFLLISPASKGTVTLKSANYNDPPLIDPNYFSEISDIEIANKSLDIIPLYYTLTPTMNRYSPKFITPPECGEYPGSFTMEYTKCYIKYRTRIEGLNPCCTARMGPATDKTSVVDSQLKVHNIEGLRVVDASIIPIPPKADLFAPELMIGEKASDIICNSYK